MFKLSETKTFSSGTSYIRPGTYLAEITKVTDSENMLTAMRSSLPTSSTVLITKPLASLLKLF